MLKAQTEVASDGRGNRLLDSLPPDDRSNLVAKMARSDLPVRTVLFEAGAEVRYVAFPLEGVVSLVTPLKGGTIVEVATIGNEGIVGVPTVQGGSMTVRAISQVAGSAMTLPTAEFAREVERSHPLAQVVQRYIQALVGQVAQAAACNRLHSSEQRLSRWLLMSHDRVGRDEFQITQEFLGQMLGSRRATVATAALALQRAGLIAYHYGHLRMINRPGLEKVACECYAIIRSELDAVTA